MNFNSFNQSPTKSPDSTSPFTSDTYLNDLPAFSGEVKETDRKEKNLEKFEQFFDGDMLVKKTMLDMAPTASDNFDEDSRIQYSDRLFDGLRTISDTFKNFGASIPKSYRDRLDQIQKDLIESGADMGKLSAFYRSDISDMSPSFVEKVNSEVVGYYLFGYGGEDAKTVNEMLHFIHASKVNNENLLQDLPLVDTYKINERAFAGINLLGRENETARQIFEALKGQPALGQTDIVALKDRIIMMVRDSGHALTMEIDNRENPEEFYIDYHIPKICNANKVNLLPGVRKVSEDSDAKASTTGIFQSPKDSVAADIRSFINMVPTDSDIWR